MAINMRGELLQKKKKNLALFVSFDFCFVFPFFYFSRSSETCIKGHRSSTCRHTDRPLFEIKKKGRPVTQCDHCRELRKTKQVHVKCLCEAREDNTTVILPPAIKKGVSHHRPFVLRLA